MKLLKCLLVLFFLWVPIVSYAMRDPFSIEQLTSSSCDLNKLPPGDLCFIGAITFSEFTLGFLSDPMGHICQIRTGNRLGSFEVIDVLPDEIVISDGQQYVVIK
jgi:hypothetical protein